MHSKEAYWRKGFRVGVISQDTDMKYVTLESDAHPGDVAAVYARRRFEGGSAPHVAAMGTFPGSRCFEVSPLPYLLSEGRSCLFDLFAGTGFASYYIHTWFGGRFLFEPHVAPLRVAGPNTERHRWHRSCALSAESFEGLPAADMAVCLAGFHHVLGVGNPRDRDSHRRQRLEVLELWRSRLAHGGRLLIADVPMAGTATGWVEGDLDGLMLPAGCAVGPKAQVGTQPTFPPHSHDLTGYLAEITAFCRELRLSDPEPAIFFDQVVAEQSLYGHVACLDSPQELASLFRDAGFEHVRAFVAPTPWLFPSKADAIWFVHELLGIGQPCDHPSALGPAELESLEAGIRNHLDLRQVSEGVWAVAWKLMYVAGDRQ